MTTEKKLTQQIEKLEEEKTTIVAFEKKAQAVMKRFRDLTLQKKKLEKQEKAIKAKLTELCEEHDIKSLDNEFVKISYIKGSETTSINLTRLKQQEPEAYEQLAQDYPKVITKRPYVRITAKEQ